MYVYQPQHDKTSVETELSSECRVKITVAPAVRSSAVSGL